MKVEIRGYRVVANYSLEVLSKEVRRMINEGFEPFGGIGLSCSNYDDPREGQVIVVLYAQAMVRRDM